MLTDPDRSGDGQGNCSYKLAAFAGVNAYTTSVSRAFRGAGTRIAAAVPTNMPCRLRMETYSAAQCGVERSRREISFREDLSSRDMFDVPYSSPLCWISRVVSCTMI